MTRRDCIEADEMARFLSERCTDVEEREIRGHLDVCEKCRGAMERAAGEQRTWNDVRFIEPEPTADTLEIDRRRIQSLFEPAEEPWLGRLQGYDVLEIVGRGATGIVVKARDPKLDRFVAIKILDPVYSGLGAARVRFEREARAVATVVDEHVVPIHAVDEVQGVPFIVMSFIDGRSLRERIDGDGPVTTRDGVRLGLQIARGLAAAHAQGVVHRDVKPANVMLTAGTERAIVTDFGLARVADDASMTSMGSIAGTPEFMSPEQARGAAVDARADLFSMGSVLYAACTGRAPFRSESVFGVIKRVCEDEPRSIRELSPDVDSWFVEFIEKLQRKDPDERFQTAEDVVELLQAELQHLQNPIAFPEPPRDWRRRQPALRYAGVVAWVASGLLALGAALLVFGLGYAFGGPGYAGTRPSGEPLELASVPPPEPLGTPGKFTTVAGTYDGDVVDGYGIYLPHSHSLEATRDYPVLMFLPGGCAVGGEIADATTECSALSREILWCRDDWSPETQEEEELSSYLLDTFIVVVPHMKGGSFEERQFYAESGAMLEILDEVRRRCAADMSRVYLTGAGRGGHGVWGLASRMPQVFAAAVAIRGNRNGIVDYSALGSLPILAVHKTGDSEVCFDETAGAIAQLERTDGLRFERFESMCAFEDASSGGERILLASEGDGWDNVFESKVFYRWLLSHRRRS